MAFSKSPMFHLLLVSIFLASLSGLTEAQSSPYFPKQYCSNTTTFAPNSTYHTNRDRLLSSLSSNATIPTGFLNMAVGRSPDVVYGLFLCRGDIYTNECKSCVQEASKQLKELCPVEKVSLIYFDECLLRYSNENFFSVVTREPDYQLLNTQNVSDPERFMDLLAKTMRGTASEAASSQTGKKLGTEKVNYTSFQNLYTLAQCTADLSVRDCNSCLDYAISMLPSCCNGRPGGRVLMPSCNVRYELYSFYNENNVPADPPENEPLGPGSTGGKSGISSGTIIAIVVPVVAVLMLVFMMLCFIRSRAKKRYENIREDSVSNDITSVESLQFDLATIENATDKFSDANKLGEGGFGEVYKGTLPNGDQIAVKRLSKSSGQGAQEFKNEVVLVAKLQHKNLVKLLGFCCQGQEKILVYEYVPNKSLDFILFDSENKGRLDWATRYKIIAGIARGILYLHEDSRLRIIHRDLKASNILLDSNLNPKISDFGMAKIFGVDQTQGNTSRIVGTYGYMSPEYAMQGHFSVKSDVYSFGVLILEIVIGKKSSGFYQSGEAQDLLSYAWKHWKDGTPLEILDPTLNNTYSRDEVLRCIHLGLLCVQENSAQRPTMSTIVLSMNSYSITLSSPQQPAFVSSKIKDSDYSTSQSLPFSVNDVSITELYPR